jgi:hypothetical protein
MWLTKTCYGFFAPLVKGVEREREQTTGPMGPKPNGDNMTATLRHYRRFCLKTGDFCGRGTWKGGPKATALFIGREGTYYQSFGPHGQSVGTLEGWVARKSEVARHAEVWVPDE